MDWFAFSFKLPDGRHPAELAAQAILKEPKLFSLGYHPKGKIYNWRGHQSY